MKVVLLTIVCHRAPHCGGSGRSSRRHPLKALFHNPAVGHVIEPSVGPVEQRTHLRQARIRRRLDSLHWHVHDDEPLRVVVPSQHEGAVEAALVVTVDAWLEFVVLSHRSRSIGKGFET